MPENLMYLIVGAAIGIISSWIKAWIDRETATSNELLRLRIQALNAIWLRYMKARDTYSHMASMKYKDWLEKHKDNATVDINAFRAEIDKHQIVLPHEIVDALRDIDTYMHGLLFLEDKTTGQYKKEIDDYLATLTEKSNSVLTKRTHSINLKFRT